MLISRVRGSLYAKKQLFLLQPPIQVFGIEGRYAHAMYSAAAKQKNLEQVESELSKVDELIRTNDKLSEYLANPTLDKYKKQCELITGLVKVLVYPKFDDFSKKLFPTFSDRSYCNLSFRKKLYQKNISTDFQEPLCNKI